MASNICLKGYVVQRIRCPGLWWQRVRSTLCYI